MKRLSLFLLWISMAAFIAGCGEVPQEKTAATTNRGDTPAWQGAKNPFVAQGWTPGNKASWETQMQNRVQYQNEYTKIN
jgi:hypothetical protein